VTQNQLRHEQLPLRRERPDLPLVPIVSGFKPREGVFQDYLGAAAPEPDITVCSATTVQDYLRLGKGLGEN
jgi:hypothetical protein